MKYRSVKLILFLLISILFFNKTTFAQGISRSTGIGLRIGFWNITDHPTKINLSGYGESATVDISGTGIWLNFFSRLHNNWFMEFNLGTIGSVHEEHSDYIIQNLDVSAIVPLLFGIRYDLLSSKFPSAIQPYLSAGSGPYWITSVSNQDIQFGGEQTIESNLQYGAYTGGGIYILLTNWLALNFDLKYHFVDFKFEQEYSGLEFDIGTSLMWGRQREIFQIKEIKTIVSDIYPAYYQFYNFYPLALVTIKNLAGYTIEVNVRSHIKHYSERPKDSGFIQIEKGKTKDFPVTAIFGSTLFEVANREPAVLDIEIEARAGRILKKEISAQVTIHNRNAWNGEIDKLGFFLTPDNEEVLQMSRQMINDAGDQTSEQTVNLQKAKAVFEELKKMGIRYHYDPNIPYYQDDRVQFALETLQIGSGDCDDLVVLYASLLQSVGIHTAFVEVTDPQKQVAHLYLLFDSGVAENDGYVISSNEKRFIIRPSNSKKENTVWIPVETTLIDRGFEEAWKTGALQYLQEGILRNGISDGWVRIFDVE